MNESIKIAVCDNFKEDQQMVADLISEYLDQNNLYAFIDTFQSGEALLSSDTSCYDLIFMDIYMNGINGMEAAKKLILKNKRIQIVFISSSMDFAVEAFDIEALHYIVKPIRKKQFFRVLDKFFEGFTTMKTIEVKVGRIKESVYLSDIIYIEAKGKKTLFHLKGRELEVSQSLAEMRSIIPEGKFCMPIRWALVPMAEIVSITGNKLCLSDQTELPVSRTKREETKEAFAEFKWVAMRRKMRGKEG